MDNDSYKKWIKNLPIPTDAQFEAFSEHICGAHSWYKHIPLLDGAEFVFFLAPDAGAGYTEDSPRLHYSWKTTSEYRRRFGHLDYIWRTEPNVPFDRDTRLEYHGMPVVGLPSDGAGSKISLPAELLENASVILYPYVSSQLAVEEWPTYPYYEEELMELIRGKEHPDRNHLVKLKELNIEYMDLHDRLSDEEHDLAFPVYEKMVENEITLEGYIAINGMLPPDVHRYLQLYDEMNKIYTVLHSKERKKVDQALDWLSKWLKSI
jgi:hypothetical protein